MSLSKEWTIWHLTPRGWGEGSTRMDGIGVQEVPPPPDRVLSVEWEEEQTSMYGKTRRLQTEVWRSPDGGEVARLFALHGPPPERL